METLLHIMLPSVVTYLRSRLWFEALVTAVLDFLSRFAQQLLLTHNPSIANQLAEQTDESGLTIASLAAMQGTNKATHFKFEAFFVVVGIYWTLQEMKNCSSG